MADTKTAIQKLRDGIILAIDTKINQAPYDKTVRGRITKTISKNKYKVSINNKEYIVKSKALHAINEVVNICIPQNNTHEMFIVSDNNNVVSSNDLVLDVKSLGVKGDGVSDDTIAIQKVIDQAHSQNNVKTIYFPEGTYIISKGINLYSNVTIRGSGSSSVIKLKNNADNNIDMFQIKTSENHDITIKDIKIDGNKENQIRSNYTTCIQFHNTENILIENVIIVNSLIEGVYIYNCSNVKILNSTASGNGFYQEDASGFHMDTCKNSIINNCMSFNNGFHGFIFSSSTEVMLNDCIAEFNGWDGIRMQYSTANCNVNNCMFLNNFRGIYLSTDSHLNNIKGSILKGGIVGLVFNSSYENVILYVTITDNDKGIETVQGTEYNYIHGIIFKNNSEADTLLVGDSSIIPMDTIITL